MSDYQKFICGVCGTIYDEALGDPTANIAPGTRFADLPEDWFCPDCGAAKEHYSPYVE